MTPKLLHFSASLLAGTAALICAVNSARAADPKPNVVHIGADDLGWKDVGFITDFQTTKA